MTVLFKICTVLAIASLVASFFIVLSGVVSRELRQHPNRLILFLSFCDAMFALKYGVTGILPNSSQLECRIPSCYLQAAFSQFWGLASISWNACIAFNLIVNLRKPFIDTSKWYKYYHLYVWTLAGSTTTILFALHQAGPSGDTTCWFDQNKQATFRLMFFLPLVIYYGIGILALLVAISSLRFLYGEGSNARRRMVFRMIWFVGVFQVCWLGPLIHQSAELLQYTGEGFKYIDVIGCSIQGFANATVWISSPPFLRFVKRILLKLDVFDVVAVVDHKEIASSTVDKFLMDSKHDLQSWDKMLRKHIVTFLLFAMREATKRCQIEQYEEDRRIEERRYNSEREFSVDSSYIDSKAPDTWKGWLTRSFIGHPNTTTKAESNMGTGVLSKIEPSTVDYKERVVYRRVSLNPEEWDVTTNRKHRRKRKSKTAKKQPSTLRKSQTYSNFRRPAPGAFDYTIPRTSSSVVADIETGIPPSATRSEYLDLAATADDRMDERSTLIFDTSESQASHTSRKRGCSVFCCCDLCLDTICIPASSLFVGDAFTDENSQNNQYRFIDYAPRVFRRIRLLDGITDEIYAESLNPEVFLTDLANQKFSEGRSGSFFCFSPNKLLIIKTIPKNEAVLLRRMIRDYFLHLLRHKKSFINKFYGCHSIQMHYGDQLYFVIMRNVFCSPKVIHERYDLKGSWISRTAWKKGGSRGTGALGFDTDIQKTRRKMKLPQAKKNEILRGISEDANFLSRLNIMDYSILIGIHFKDRADEERLSRQEDEQENEEQDEDKNKDKDKDKDKDKEEIKEESSEGSSEGSSKGSEKLKGKEKSESDREEPGINQEEPWNGGVDVWKDQGIESRDGREVYYISVIDTLQLYDWNKKLERFLKVTLQRKDRDGVSVQPPEKYKARFIDNALQRTLLKEEEERDRTFGRNNGVNISDFLDSSRSLSQDSDRNTWSGGFKPQSNSSNNNTWSGSGRRG